MGFDLELRGLTKRYGTICAVDGAMIRIPQGQMVGIIGRSGAGKSTLLRLINRLIDPTAGAIQFGGTDVTRLRGRHLLDWRSRCAMVFQQFNLVKRLDVLTNVLMGRLSYHGTLPTLFKCFSSEERALAIQALDRVEVADQALKRVDRLSGGQQQRVAIARALMQRPEIILADEPIASLDLRSATKVMDTLRRINREDGITVIASLHDLPTARTYCSRIIGMAEGKVVFDSSPETLTPEAVCHIYGIEGAREELGEPAACPPPETPVRPSIEPVPAFS
jgi:phosphonate transport system ATP-binding protein